MSNLRVCPICKAIGIRARVLCAHCEIQLRDLRSPVERRESGYTVHSLFAWRSGEMAALGWLIHGLKKKEEAHFWTELANWMVATFAKIDDEPTLIPVPARGRNHARGLAGAVQTWTGWKLEEPLRYSHAGQQKNLTRLERAQRTMIACKKYRAVVLVDDVITTGATIRAAYQALGRPARFWAWCLADRRPCGDSDALL